MKTLREHYSQLLGLDKDWQVSAVDLHPEEKRVDIALEHQGGQVSCPSCDKKCGIADHARERSWRHLDTMQFETRLTAKIPRCRCKDCGVKTIRIPWAGKHSRFTLLFEAFAIEVLKACSTVKAACKLVGIGWDPMHQIMSRAVERGLARRHLENVEYVGIDEKSFRRGHKYVTVLNDLKGSRVLEVSEGRGEKSADILWHTLNDEQKERIRAVSIDMWKPYISSVNNNITNAEIVHDRFHISQHLNKAVDMVRRQENKALMSKGDESLKGTKQLWLFNPENMSEERWLDFESLKDLGLKTSKAWAIKEYFRWFWEYKYVGSAKKFFNSWHCWAVRCRITPVRKVAKMLRSHLDNILTYFRHRITNAVSEGLNSRIQSIKTSARGFRSFMNYRIRILFFCGKLDLGHEK